MNDGKPVLYIVVPCYNEEEVLPLTAPIFRAKLGQLIRDGSVSERSRILYVDDGSRDGTWRLITGRASESPACRADGIHGGCRYHDHDRL